MSDESGAPHSKPPKPDEKPIDAGNESSNSRDGSQLRTHDELPQRHSSLGFLSALAIVAIAAIGFSFFLGANSPRDHKSHGSKSPQLHQPFPALEVAGWINGPGPTAEEQSEQVLVIDAWAYWCGPCRSAIPPLIELHKKYQKKGVTFIGLTPEGLDPASLQQSKTFVESLRIPWANGFGAVKPLTTLNVTGIPQLWVVDRKNRIVFHEIGWAQTSPEEIEEAIVAALKSSPAASTN